MKSLDGARTRSKFTFTKLEISMNQKPRLQDLRLRNSSLYNSINNFHKTNHHVKMIRVLLFDIWRATFFFRVNRQEPRKPIRKQK